MSKTLLTVLAVALCAYVASGEEVVGCGGFIEFSKDVEKLAPQNTDWSKLATAEVVTADGVIKYTIEAAPNGYYYIPVYDKGDFFVRISSKKGLTFEPAQHPVHIDSTCNNDADINFKLTGFRVEGAVLSAGSDQGPDGVTVSLSSAAGTEISRTQTVKGGRYTFDSVVPGTFVVAAQHDTYQFQPAEHKVDGTWGNMAVKEPFVVPGYRVSGRVVSTEEGVGGVEVFLFARGSFPKAKAACVAPTGVSAPQAPASAASSAPLCFAKSSRDGSYVFQGVPVGEYSVVAVYQGAAGSSYDISPAFVDTVVSHGDSAISTPFKVAGFTVLGRVVDGNGSGVSDVEIFVDGAKTTTTDADGAYALEQVQAGTYTIAAKAPRTKFSSVNSLSIKNAKTSIPNITVLSYELCGSVGDVRNVKLSTGQTVRSGSDGRYCFDVVPGSYDVTPEITSAEKSKGVVFTPASRSVRITNAAVSGVDFGQTLVSVSGSIKCVSGTCKKPVQISLVSPSRGNVDSTKTKDGFTFKDVVPGEYTLEVESPGSCWQGDKMAVVVSTDDVTGLSFVEMGSSIDISSSHETEIKYTSTSGKAGSHSLKKGHNRFCVDGSGKFTLEPTGCHLFAKTKYEWDSAAPEVLDMTATHHLVTGTITVSDEGARKQDAPGPVSVTIERMSNVHETAKSSHPALKAMKASKDGKTVKVSAKVVQETATARTLSFEYWAVRGEVIEVTPESEGRLFYPSSSEFTVATDDCSKLKMSLTGRPGLYITGRVTPPTEGVALSVVFAESDGEIAYEVKTNKKGEYEAGPLYDDLSYRVTPSVDSGYSFQEEDGNTEKVMNFKVMRLGSAVITVKGEDGKHVPGVLLSLSGKGFRSNNATKDGPMHFRDLFPGDYFVRPVLKEYEFTPSTYSFAIREGTAEKFEFKSKRVAFSAFGTVVGLTGLPQARVTVEAIGANGSEREEAVSDQDGAFRIRGLKPGNTYTIRVKSGETIARAEPAETQITMKAADHHGNNFVVFRAQTRFTLSGRVSTSDIFMADLEVQLLKSGSVQATATLEFTDYFEFGDLPAGTYQVRVKSKLSPKDYSFTGNRQETVRLSGDSEVSLGFGAQLRITSQEGNSPVWALAVGVITVLVCLYPDTVMEYYNIARGKPTPRRGVKDDAGDYLAHVKKAASTTRRANAARR